MIESAPMQLRRKILLVTALFVVVTLAGCHANTRDHQRILGSWEGKNEQGDVDTYFEFRENGIGGMAFAGRGTALGEALRYRIEDGTIHVDGQDSTSTPQQWRYTLAKDRLELRNPDELLKLRPATSDFARACRQEIDDYWNTHFSTRQSN